MCQNLRLQGVGHFLWGEAVHPVHLSVPGPQVTPIRLLSCAGE